MNCETKQETSQGNGKSDRTDKRAYGSDSPDGYFDAGLQHLVLLRYRNLTHAL